MKAKKLVYIDLSIVQKLIQEKYPELTEVHKVDYTRYGDLYSFTKEGEYYHGDHFYIRIRIPDPQRYGRAISFHLGKGMLADYPNKKYPRRLGSYSYDITIPRINGWDAKLLTEIAKGIRYYEQKYHEKVFKRMHTKSVIYAQNGANDYQI
jgi:hypothetical protein